MAYIIQNSQSDRDNLDYRFEGGSKTLTVEGLEYEGHRLRGSGLATCFMMSLKVPLSLVPAVPTRIVVKPTAAGSIPDFAPAANFSTNLASDRFIAIAEQREPSLHQFIRIKECIDERGRSLDTSFFLINILTRLAAVDIERSDVEWKYREQGKDSETKILVRKGPSGRPPRFTLHRETIKGHHLWRGTRHGLMGVLFCSDAFRDASLEAGLSGLTFARCEEV